MTASKKTQEWGLVERTRQLYPWFVPGEIVSGEEPPDFALQSTGERIAIEVTRIFHPRESARFSRRETETFWPKIMCRAEELAAATELPALDVIVFFGDPEPHQIEETAKSLVAFIRDHLVEDCETLDLPNGGVIRIMRPRAGHVPRWHCGSLGVEPTLTQEVLAKAIQKKNRDIPRYREGYDRAWLIIASTFFPFSANFIVPDAVSEWRFAFDFDKVLVLSEARGSVFALQHTDAGTLPHAGESGLG